MCGIAGFFSEDRLTSQWLDGMVGAMRHRGPDDGGSFAWNPDGTTHAWKDHGPEARHQVGLGFRRLSILDLSSMGAQPMSSPEGRYHLVFNGQIYNYRELREELSSSYSFRSTSDTEVLLYAYARWGADCVLRFNGMFAFAILDTLKRELFLARDRFGIKPLYYYRDGRGWFFASEIPTLLRSMPSRPVLRVSALARYLSNQWVPDPDTLLENVFRLAPGHSMTLRFGENAKPQPYWDLEYETPEVHSESWADRLDRALDASVSRHLQSDVPIGFFLSGGVDSSLLTAKASRLGARPTAFTVGLKWQKGQGEDADVHYAKQVQALYGFEHELLFLEPSVVDILPRVVGALGEPIADAAALSSYLICEAASSRFKVMWSGQGADEILGGYAVYPAGRLVAAMADAPLALRGKLAPLLSRIPYRWLGQPVQAAHRLRKIAQAATMPWPKGFMRLRQGMTDAQWNELLTPELSAVQEPVLQFPTIDWEKVAKIENPYHQMMYLDSKTYLPSLNLLYSDRTSMAHSVELRVPFLDLEIVDLVRRMPAEEKVSYTYQKEVLKRVGMKYFSREILYRKKQGFGPPLRKWFQKELVPLAEQVFSPARLDRQGIFNSELPMRWLREHREHRADHCLKLYSLLSLQLWLEKMELS